LTTPHHVAIIMDGNGRWAKRRGLPRTMGHRKGVEAVRETVQAAGEAGVRYLTLFAFSSENWNRPEEEITDLMGLLKLFIRRDLAELHKENIRIRVIGDRARLDREILGLLVEAEELTRNNSAMHLVIAFNYGGRDEIVRAAKRLAEAVGRGELSPANVNEHTLSAFLDTAGIPDHDVIIRTSGEQRLSNFLLWQAAYTEFVFVPVLWPDFDKSAFHRALDEYASRERRFGAVPERDVALGS
jgi:undecaprenyl diphosphate synthase